MNSKTIVLQGKIIPVDKIILYRFTLDITDTFSHPGNGKEIELQCKGNPKSHYFFYKSDRQFQKDKKMLILAIEGYKQEQTHDREINRTN